MKKLTNEEETEQLIDITTNNVGNVDKEIVIDSQKPEPDPNVKVIKKSKDNTVIILLIITVVVMVGIYMYKNLKKND